MWRAVLQVIINDHVDPRPAFADQQVGKVARKAKDFSEYCRLALEKLGLRTNVSLCLFHRPITTRHLMWFM